MGKYKKTFELSLKDIRIIEDALHRRVKDLASSLGYGADGEAPQMTSEEAQTIKKELADTRKVLGHIHNQKIWYEPEDFVPRG